LQILEVDQGQRFVFGNLENDRKHGCLRFIERQHTGKKQRAHVANSGPHRCSGFAEHIPKLHGKSLKNKTLVHKAATFHAIDNALLIAALGGHAGEVPFDIRREHGNAHLTEGLRHSLQGHCFTRAGSAGDQTMAVGHLQRKANIVLA
jgi:hypothetical protein